ncbi:MAG: tRNA (adenosine(37)-N6)-dimethylallyltransferase MiaA, partial [Gammaproteobacteria bacterium]|nr:tRNA (adenosine(37)-N6)-dimethylallyltransferase MiaA [Gammaproteobacteria bacterium]
MENKIIMLKGPTACGKTDHASKLVKNHPLEIISVDSVMVYKGLDIGSAKPTSEELKLCPHHLIDVCEPTENYSAGEFYQDVQQVIQSIIGKG